MDRLNERLVVSASDLVGYLGCPHLTGLDLEVLETGGVRPKRVDDDLEILFKRGLQHEADHLQVLKDRSLDVVEIDDVEDPDRRAGLLAQEAQTLDAMRAGADVIFQGTFLDETGAIGWRGHADFLTRVEQETSFGAFGYEPEDTKLAKKVKPSAVLQLCHYAEQIERLQGTAPEWIHVVLGSGQRASVRLADVAAYYRVVKRRFLSVIDERPVSYPVPVAACSQCRWEETCSDRWERDDHLSRVNALGRDQVRKLAKVGITTMAGLGSSAADLAVPGMGEAPLRRLQHQARLQVVARDTGTIPVEAVEPIERERGLAALPLPDPGDLFYDIEGDPLVGDLGLEYLHGLAHVDGAGFQFTAYWAHDAMQEKKAFEDVIDHIVRRRAEHPQMHVYHYAAYEVSALGKLMGRYGTREDELDDLLRGGVFVDLYRVVRQGLVIGSPSYSLKKLEPLYMQARTAEITDAGSSIVEYERWLESGEQSILDAIEEYNQDDVESTWRLRDWLEERRAELGDDVVPRPAIRVAQESVPDEADVAEDQLRAELLAGIDEVPTADASDEVRGRWLMAQMLRWHQREAKPDWWQYFRRILEADDAELLLDTESLSGLRLVDGPTPAEGKKEDWTYEFDTQEHKLSDGSSVSDPATERRKMLEGVKGLSGPGEIIELDTVANRITLRRKAGADIAHPTALIPTGPIPTKAQRAALRRLGTAVLEHGLDGPGPYAAARQLLGRRLPRVAGVTPGDDLRQTGESTVDAACRLVLGLDRSVLPVQGPPGAGKTYTAARAIVAAIAAGKRVGVTANSHAVIGNLLEAVLEAADEAGQDVRILQKPKDAKATPPDPRITYSGDNEEIETAVADGEVDLVAGTPFLFARDGLSQTLHLLVVDEAGQLSLANVLAVATSAQNLVLVGDPQQLAQPSKGTHPVGAAASALDHVLQGHPTVPPDQGLFLDCTWRMHPRICEFISEQVYEGRLASEAHCATQSIDDGDPVGGSGLRWVPVPHEGNRTSSEEEGKAIASLVDSLVGRGWTDAKGQRHVLGLDDVLIVAPYNAQVHLLADALPDGARVGTVDRFQGQEAPVVIVSMTASSAEDVPRGMDFLYSRNRMNVAVSRAKALSIVVGSPTLLTVTCRTLEQMRLANVLCRFVELADEVTAPV